MKLEKLKIYKNKTYRFLVPVLKELGEEFYFYLNKLDRRAFGTSSKSVTYETDDKLLYILFDISYNRKLFLEFLAFVKEKVYYVDNYCFGNIQNTDFHMIVIKFPKNFENAFDLFNQGKYSKMFSFEEINKYFKNEIDINILQKKETVAFLLIREIKEKFGEDIISLEEILTNKDNWEYSIPPLSFEESFE